MYINNNYCKQKSIFLWKAVSSPFDMSYMELSTPRLRFFLWTICSIIQRNISSIEILKLLIVFVGPFIIIWSIPFEILTPILLPLYVFPLLPRNLIPKKKLLYVSPPQILHLYQNSLGILLLIFTQLMILILLLDLFRTR